LDLIPKLKPRELMRALLQMTMETEDTTERLSAPTVPSWNFSPATPISTAEPGNQAEEENQNHRTTPPTSTCATQRSHFDRASAARTPGSIQEAAFPCQNYLFTPRKQNSGRQKLDLGDELVNLRTELAMARGPKRQAVAGSGELWLRGCLSCCVLGPPLLPPLSCSPETETGVLYRRYCCMVVSGWWWLRGICAIVSFFRGDQGILSGSIGFGIM